MKAYRPLKIKVPETGDPRVKFLFNEIVRRQISILEVASAVGMDVRSIYRWREGHNPRLDLLEACLNTLGHTLKVVPLEK